MKFRIEYNAKIKKLKKRIGWATDNEVINEISIATGIGGNGNLSILISMNVSRKEDQKVQRWLIWNERVV